MPRRQRFGARRQGFEGAGAAGELVEEQAQEANLGRTLLNDRIVALLHRRMPRWNAQWVGLFTQLLIVCAYCGKCGWERSSFKTVSPLAGHVVGPAAMANMLLAAHTLSDSGDWWACAHCLAHDNARMSVVPLHPPTYARLIVAAHPMQAMLLSMLSTPLTLKGWAQGFTHGKHAACLLLDSPLLSWAMVDRRLELGLGSFILDILRYNLQHNPLYERFACMLQQQVDRHMMPYPVLDLTVLGARTLRMMHHMPCEVLPEVLQEGVGSFGLLESVAMPVLSSKSTLYEIGSVAMQQGGRLVDTHLRAGCDGVVDLGVTLEAVLFPFLFPNGRGFYQRGLPGFSHLTQYLQHRAHQMFSLFSLFKLYLLHMWQVRQCNTIARAVSEVVLQRDLARYRQQNPGSSDADAMRHVIKYKVPHSLIGSPSWHRQRLQDLLAMVDKWGMPHFFLTLTAADRISNGMQWEEIKDLDVMMQRFAAGSSWRDAPVECAHAFHRRVQKFMRAFMPLDKEGLLGRVQHHMIRYEVQARGALHAHIVLWVHEDDVEDVAAEVVAAVPGVFVREGVWQLHVDATPLETELMKLVTTYQMHTCYPNLCCKEGHCKSHFPFAAHPARRPSFNDSLRLWMYYRPTEQHRNVVPYHPGILLAWKAHMNLQRITAHEWSLYVLKYATKANGPVDLNMDMSSAERLGLEGASPDMLQLLSTMVTAKIVSPCDAAIQMAGIPILSFSHSIAVFHSQPPAMRTKLRLAGHNIPLADVDVYCLRPIELQDSTLYEYFTQYELRESHLKGRQGELRQVTGANGGPLQDARGKWVYMRIADTPVRFTSYNPGTQTEGFAYNLLLQYIPFHAESELLSPENVTQTYYDECWLRGIITCEDDVQDLVMQYSRQQLLGTDQTTSLVQRLLEKHHDMDHVLPVQPVLHVVPCADVDEFAAVATVMPSMEQQQALRHIIHKQNGICVVSGGPGTGKTFLTKHLLHHYRTAAVPHIATATTGAAATRLSRHASTIHSALCIFGAGRYLVPLAPSNPQYEAMRSAKVLIIDEMSMLSCQMLSLVLYRLQQCCGCRSFADVLQEKLIVLVGDHAQLPPVCHCKTDQDEFCRACHISSHPLWMAADKLTLKHSVRHADDPAFVDFLNIIRGRPPTQAEIDDIFGDAIITEREAVQMATDDCTILCTNRDTCDRFNQLVLQNLYGNDVVPNHMLSNVGTLQRLHTWLMKPGFNTLPVLAIGARVILTSNADVSIGLVNGATGRITDITYGAPPPSMKYDGQATEIIKKIMVEMDGTGAIHGVRRTLVAHTWDNRRTYVKQAFPIALAYSITGHKAQGATLTGPTIVSVTNVFTPGLLYVMLSRVQTRQQLHLLQRLTPGMFHPMVVPGMD